MVKASYFQRYLVNTILKTHYNKISDKQYVKPVAKFEFSSKKIYRTPKQEKRTNYLLHKKS